MVKEKKTKEDKTAEEKTAKTTKEKAEKTTAKKTAKTKVKAESFEFQSEVKQLLNILVYSLYKHKEVFLRELISNAVDALNKVQFETLIDSDIEDKDLDFRIETKRN